MKESKDDMLPTTSSSEPKRSDTTTLADELLRAADKIKWPRSPEIGALEHMAELSHIAGYYCLEDLMDT